MWRGALWRAVSAPVDLALGCAKVAVEGKALAVGLHASANAKLPTSTIPSLAPQHGGYMLSGHEGVPEAHMDDPPKFLVTGAGGQIGAELVPFLRSKVGGENVIATDVKSTRARQLAPGGPFAYLDVTDRDSLARLVLEHAVTHIVHLATLLSAIGERSPALALRVNTLGIQNVLEVAVSANASVFAPSTIAVFGATTPKRDTPDDTVCHPATMYGVTKVHQELLGAYYAAKLGVDFRSLRYPGIISSHTLPGGGTTDYAVEMYMAAVAGVPYDCFIQPDTVLPMMYMPDCLRATWELVAAARPDLSRSTYNVTSLSFTPAELEASIREKYPDFRVTYRPDFRQEIASTWPETIDDGLAQRDWGWIPAYGLPEMTGDMLSALARKHAALAGTAAAAAAIVPPAPAPPVSSPT